MFARFKRKPAPAPDTFAVRVRNFWSWFAQHSDRLLATIDDKRCADLQPEVSAQMNRLYPGAAWVFGPGENYLGHSFTFTAEGDRYRQLLTAYWLRQAPKLPGWAFYATRQASPEITSHKIRIRDVDFDPLEFWIAPHVDDQSEQIDITIWHPAFPAMAERDRWTPIFLWLDEVLGELGTQKWIGEIKIDSTRLADSMPLTEFGPYVRGVVAQHGWKLTIPGETWSSYQLKEPESGGGLRQDIVAGSTALFLLIQDTDEGHIDPDPLEGTGAELVYITFPRSLLHPGQEASGRGIYEDALKAVLEPVSGELLGGATGYDHAYIDVLLFDGPASLKIIEKTLRQQGLGPGTTIEYFAKSRAHERIVL